MFNMAKSKFATKPLSKALQEDSVEPKNKVNPKTQEKSLPRNETYSKATTESQLAETRKEAKETKIIEKILNDNNGQYVQHRSSQSNLTIPPINMLVEKISQDRIRDYWTPLQEKQPHWSQEPETQNGKLPQSPMIAKQHDKPVLQNDPDRFIAKDMVLDPTKSRKQSPKNLAKPIIGDITTASLDRVVKATKTGESIDYDTAILAILKQASSEKRELSKTEQQAVSSLKLSRTKKFL